MAHWRQTIPSAEGSISSSIHVRTDPTIGSFEELPAIGRAVKQMRAQLGRIWELLALWKRRHHDRKLLRSFSYRDIHDFCPTQMEAEAEMQKPFWQA